MRVSDLCDFIGKRELAREMKEGIQHRGLSALDPIIRQYRFCNVRRNDDRVTKWILEHYVKHFGSAPDMWFALVVARLFNNEPTLEAIRPFVLPFQPARMRKILKDRSALGKKNFNAAYIVSTNGRSMNKIDYIIDILLVPMWKRRREINDIMANTHQLAKAHEFLSSLNGLGSFMAAQVLADLKYADDPKRWDDFHTFAASGPGSKRGLNRVMGRPLNAPWKEAEFRETLDRLRNRVNAHLDMDPITAQDIQNCLCEFDKYERARLGEGTPKQKYKRVNIKEND